jgi:hypothetical protein
VVAIRGADTFVGFSEALGNNFLGIPRTEDPGADRRAGQIAGDLISIPLGIAEATAGGGTALGGGTLTVLTAGGGSPLTVPATAVGLAAVAHGTYAATNAANNLSKALDEGIVKENAPRRGGSSLTKKEPLPAKKAKARGTAETEPQQAPSDTGPQEPYNRQKHYGRTPKQSDRQAVGAGPDEVADHDPPLVKRYYEGDPATGEKPGYLMTEAERKASAGDRGRMAPQSRPASDRQGGEMSRYSKEQKKKLFQQNQQGAANTQSQQSSVRKKEE